MKKTEPEQTAQMIEQESGSSLEYSDPLQQFTPSQESGPTPLLPEDSSPLSGTTILQPKHCVIQPRTSSTLQTQPSKNRQFGALKSDLEVEKARASAIAPKTLQDTKYCVNLWNAWSDYRRSANGDVIQPIEELNRDNLNYWLTRFVLKVRIPK